MPESLCLTTLGSVTRQIKSVSFLRLIVSSCMAELDLFKLTCKTLMSLFFSRVSADKRAAVGMAIDSEVVFVYDADAAWPLRIEALESLWS